MGKRLEEHDLQEIAKCYYFFKQVRESKIIKLNTIVKDSGIVSLRTFINWMQDFEKDEVRYTRGKQQISLAKLSELKKHLKSRLLDVLDYGY